MSCIHIPHIRPNESIEQILSALLSVICEYQNRKTVSELSFDYQDDNPLFTSLLQAFAKSTAHKILCSDLENIKSTIIFEVNSKSISEAICAIEAYIFQYSELHHLKNPISYFLGELTCNIQQHSQAEFGMIFASLNKFSNTVDIFVADNGISIYGSYINAQKYMDKFSNSAEALDLASKGYSTKNLPNIENRGYGISSNAKMIVEGLKGTFSIISDNALFHFSKMGKSLISLPENITWNGSIVIARIPITVSDAFDFYKYIS